MTPKVAPVLVPHLQNFSLGQAWKGHDAAALGWKATIQQRMTGLEVDNFSTFKYLVLVHMCYHVEKPQSMV